MCNTTNNTIVLEHLNQTLNEGKLFFHFSAFGVDWKRTFLDKRRLDKINDGLIVICYCGLQIK